MLTRTTTALLDDLVDPANEAVWELFDTRFRPLLIAIGCRLGLTPEDAADTAQEALAEFVRCYRAGRYDRGRGRLRSWMIGILRRCIADTHRRQAVRRERGGLSRVDDAGGADDLDRLWQEERDRAVLRQAVAALRSETSFEPRTVHAFELVTFHARRPADVAEELGITPNDVYLAKHRCLKRLRSIVTEMTMAFDAEE